MGDIQVRTSPIGDSGAVMVDDQNKLDLLLIEDSDADADLFREYLLDYRSKRFRIEHAYNLDQALDKIHNQDFDLIVLDLMLPDSTGLDTIRSIHEAAPRTPVVVLSGIADDDLGQQAIQTGAQDFLHKDGLDSESLARSLHYASERGRLQTQLRSLVENNADAIVVVNRDGNVTFINKAAEKLFGKTRDDLVGTPFGYAINADGISEIQLPSCEGDPRSAEMRAVPIDWEGKSAWLASVRDITDRKRAEELQRRLLHADRLASIGMLASGVAHEVNNPASFIQNNLEELRAHLASVHRLMDGAGEHSQLVPILQEMQQMISDNLVGIDRISKIVKGLSSFSRIERDEVEQVDINDIIEVACTMTFNEIRHRAMLRKDFGNVPKVAADRGKLAQVFTNLLINAAQAIKPGDADQNQIRVSTQLDGTDIVVCVEDTGSGISQENLDRIFTPFFTTKPRGQGTGLGLPLSAEIVQKHNGRIQARSKLGEGTCFEVRLPIETGLSVTQPSITRPARRAKPGRGRVLVIDDEPMLLEAIFRMLRRNHDVVMAQGGIDGLAKIEEDPSFDVVICDLMMPEVDGVKLYATVKERWSDLTSRIVFCSGGAFTKHAKDFVNQVRQTNIIIEKPIRKNVLLSAVDQVMERQNS